jgi:hypothetical protein
MKKKCPRTGFTMFLTKMDASLMLARIELMNASRRKKSHRDAPIRVYECEFCHHWHLTSQALDPHRSSRQKGAAK